MRSEERKAARRARREARRRERRLDEQKTHGSFEWVFSYEHLYDAYRKCRRGTAWKASTQRFVADAPAVVYELRRRLMAGKWRMKNPHEFDVVERGKRRHIRAAGVRERVVERCLCDYCLMPMLGRSFILDNSASQKGKGYDFAIARLKNHLRNFYKRNGREGFILQYDFRRYFESVPVGLCEKLLREKVQDERLLSLTKYILERGGRGLSLGSQVSQTFALAAAGRVDHYAKEVLRAREYGRYMDDGYLLAKTREEAARWRAGVARVCEGLGLSLHERKTHITPLSRPFRFLRARFFLGSGGAVRVKIPREAVTRARRRLSKMRKTGVGGDALRAAAASFAGYARKFEPSLAAKKVIRAAEKMIEAG